MMRNDYSQADALQDSLIFKERQNHIYQTYQGKTDLGTFCLIYIYIYIETELIGNLSYLCTEPCDKTDQHVNGLHISNTIFPPMNVIKSQIKHNYTQLK